MSRSVKKGYYTCSKLRTKVKKMLATGQLKPMKTHSRASTIRPEFVGITFAVHNGREYIPVRIDEAMVGHKLGEFAPTRKFKGHGGSTEKSSSVR